MDQLVTLVFHFPCVSAGFALKPAHSDVDCLNENELAKAKEVVMAMDVVVRAASSALSVKNLRLMTCNVPQIKY